MASNPELNEAQNGRLKEQIVRLMQQHGNNQTLLAPKLGIKQGTLSAFLRNAHGGSWKLVQTVSLLTHIPEQWFSRGEMPAANTELVLDSRYPNRTMAARFARENGLSEDAIALVEKLELKSKDDPKPEDWFSIMRAEHWLQHVAGGPRELLKLRADATGKLRRKSGP
jgi:transposase-like protein